MMHKINFIERLLFTYTGWSIGLLKAEELEQISFSIPRSPSLKSNFLPFPARGVADPFLVSTPTGLYLFFEIERSGKTRKGEIGVAKVEIDKKIEFLGIALQERYHLSYPHVYYFNGHFFMVPESGANFSVDLYYCIEFPLKWKKVKTLLKGKPFADPTLFYWKGYWYLFVSTSSHDTLLLYLSRHIEGPYLPHPASPIYFRNLKYARPAGNIFPWKGKIFRPAQNCEKGYGKGVFLMEILDLSPNRFKEREFFFIPPCSEKFSWWSINLHHLSIIPTSNGLIGAIDGRGIGVRFLF
jgi:hypothetical protein